MEKKLKKVLLSVAKQERAAQAGAAAYTEYSKYTEVNYPQQFGGRTHAFAKRLPTYQM